MQVEGKLYIIVGNKNIILRINLYGVLNINYTDQLVILS